MMLRRAAVKLLGALSLLAAVGVSENANATETIKIGTLAPKASPWGQVFETWAKAVSAKSGGAVELQFFYNGQQGDEGAMVGKMKAGSIEVVLEQAQQTTVQNVQNVQNVTVEDRGLEPTVFWGGVGVTAGVAVVGFGLAGRAMALRNDADALDPLDAPGRREARDDVHRASVVADVLFGTAGALAVGTVVIGLMTDFGDEGASASTVVVMPFRMQDGVGLSATGRF